LKEPFGESKGVIVFTHKERDLLEMKIPVLAKTLRLLKTKYFLAMHWGFFRQGVANVSWIDFHLAAEGTLSLAPSDTTPVIRLCSRNFLPGFFRKTDSPKIWDILNVSRPAKFKNIPQFFSAVKAMYEKGFLTEVLLLCVAEKTEPELYKTYLEMFSATEREHFVFLMTLSGNNAFPLSRQRMAELYNDSRILTLFSDSEGESRVIAEALCCGTPVVAKKHLTGGGRDYLDESNSRLFETPQEAAETFIDMLENYEKYNFDPTRLQSELHEEPSIAKLEVELRRVFSRHGAVFDGPLKTEELDRNLPSHILTLPKELRRSSTNDLVSTKALMIFAKDLLGQPISVFEILRFFVERPLALLRFYFGKALKKLGGKVGK
jgi:glycosyltransferase involved in cell wall biosynthesis